MKIGLLIRDYKKLANWELRIINQIIESNVLELSLLIEIDSRNNKGLLKRNIKLTTLLNQIFGKLLFEIQFLIEKVLFKKKFTLEKEHITRLLGEKEILHIKPENQGKDIVIKDADVAKVASYNLDVLVKLNADNITGDFLKTAQHGIWMLHCENYSMNENHFIGFWEIMLKHPTVKISLIQITNTLNHANIIDTASFNRHWSIVNTQMKIYESSVSLLFKNLNLFQSGMRYPKKSLEIKSSPNKKINIVYSGTYIIRFYTNILKDLLKSINLTLRGRRYQCWTLFIGKGNFIPSDLTQLKPCKLPKNEFWADPFIFNYKNEQYIFFENYEYSKKKGKISCGKISNNELIEIKDVLDFDYHLSFPFIFEENGEIYLMPETEQNKRLEIYRCTRFPDNWEIYSTAFEGEHVCDAFFYDDDKGNKWLFINKSDNSNYSMENELYLYKVDSIKLNNLEPHSLNPVIINSEIARNGGPIFKYNEEIYRPSQANTHDTYGYALNINKIKKLTINEYEEECIKTIYPNFNKNLMSTHHLHQSNNLFVIDAAFKTL